MASKLDVLTPFLDRIENPQHRARTEEVLLWVTDTFPNLEPRIAWNQPMFTDHGTFIVGFSVARHHLAVAPEEKALRRFSDDIRRSGYEHTKMLIRLPWEKPVDYALLEKIIRFNIEDKKDCTTFWRRK